MKKLFTLYLLALSLSLFSQIPANYYNSADGKNTAALRSALQAIITNGHSVTSYAGLWTAYAKTDENSSGKIWDMYSNCSFTYASAQCGTYSSECDCYNREHTSPQSWFNSASPMVSDIFNVYPTDGKVNGMRSNYPYGEVASPTYTSGNGSKLGACSFPGYSGTVFEPIDEYKGDFARTYFYMATRYANECQSWTGEATAVYGSNLGLSTFGMNLFLKWSRQDPVSAKEIARNNAAYTIQNNRNPFIDYPGIEEYIWGNKTNSTFSTSGTSTPYLSSPSSGTIVNFGTVAFQQTDTASVYIKGMNLTGDLTVALSGTNASQFSLSVSTITQANATAGYKLVINFSAQALGLQTAQLTISGGGITATPVTLNATSTDSFLALSASGVTSTGFKANWTSSANATGYSLNVYSYVGDVSAVPQTLIEEDFISGLPTTWTKTGYTDTSLASNIKMGSSSQGAQITTPAMNMSSATNLLVRAKQYSTDANAKLTVRVNGDSVGAFLTTATNLDYTLSIPAKTTSSTISLSVGVGSGYRAYVDYVKVSTQGTILSPVSVSGYPLSVGNVLNYTVSDLQSDSAYYYTVTPQGNTTSISNEIKVRTLSLNSGINSLSETNMNYRVVTSGLLVYNLPANCNIVVHDLMGKQIQTVQASAGQAVLNLQQKGIYLVRVQLNNDAKTYKIKY
jgi:endonuclease I